MWNKKIKRTVMGESKTSVKEILYLSILSLVIIMLIVVLVLIGFAAIKGQCISVDNTAFGLLMTGLVVFLTGSIIMPKVLLSHEVEEAVKRQAKDEIEKQVSATLDVRLKSFKNDLNRCDAHLSRMIALNLSYTQPIWSIGWAFRSLKRYQSLDPSKVGLKEYKDFIELINKKIIEGSIKKFSEEIALRKECKELGHTLSDADYAWIVLSTEQCDSELKEDRDGIQISIRTAIRAVKDIVDLDYSMFFDKNSEIEKAAREILKPLCLSIGNLGRLLCAGLIRHLPDNVNEQDAKLDELNGKKILTDEILKISKYGIKGDSAQDNETMKNDFKGRFMKVLLELENKGIDLQKENLFAKKGFFNEE